MSIGDSQVKDPFSDAVDAVRVLVDIPLEVVAKVLPMEVVTIVGRGIPNVTEYFKELIFPRDSQQSLDALEHPLTKLPNKNAIATHVPEKFGDDSEVFVLYVDSDGLKTINNTYGHHYGDIYLEQIAERLQQAVVGDGIVFHLHGDEFLIVLDAKREIKKLDIERRTDHVTNPDGFADRIIEWIRESVEATVKVAVDLGHVEVPIQVSIGCVYCEDSRLETIKTNIDLADAAMYRDKAERKALMKQAHQVAEIDRASGKREFLEVHNADTSHGELVRAMTSELVTDVAHLDSHYSPDAKMNIPPSAYSDLHDALEEMGYADAARYVDGLAIGRPQFLMEDLVVGDSGLRVKTVLELSRTFHP